MESPDARVDDGSFARWPFGSMKRERLHVFFSGRVQGVGFRYTVKAQAAGYELTGIVRNLADGRVELIAEGIKSELEAFQQAIRDSEVGGFIRKEDVRWAPSTGEFNGFAITG